MIRKTFQEFHSNKRFCFLSVTFLSVKPAKSHLTLSDTQDAMIRYGHPVAVSSQILNHTCWCAKSLFGIHHPGLFYQITWHISDNFSLLLQPAKFAGTPGTENTGELFYIKQKIPLLFGAFPPPRIDGVYPKPAGRIWTAIETSSITPANDCSRKCLN